jgi:hypothetical protein
MAARATSRAAVTAGDSDGARVVFGVIIVAILDEEGVEGFDDRSYAF